MTTVVVFGGAGFLGRRLVRRLATEGMTVRVAVRHPDPARIELQSMGFDRVTVVPADVRDKPRSPPPLRELTQPGAPTKNGADDLCLNSRPKTRHQCLSHGRRRAVNFGQIVLLPPFGPRAAHIVQLGAIVVEQRLG